METCSRCGKVLPHGWTKKFDSVCISCESNVAMDELAALRAENEQLEETVKELLHRIDILEGGLVCAQCGISPYEGGLDEPF